MSNQCGSQPSSLSGSPADSRLGTKTKFHEVTSIWTIENFSCQEDVGIELISSTFSAPDDKKTKWNLQIRPHAILDKINYVSVFASLNPSGIHKQAFGKLSAFVLDQAQQETLFCKTSDIIGKYNASSNRSERGWNKFLKKDENFRTNLLIDDTLTIKVTIIYFVNNDDSTLSNAPLYSNAPGCNLSEQLGSLLKNRDFADVILSVNCTEYPAHKYILAARSPVFAAMFKHNAKESKENRVRIEDMEEEVVGEMLRYIYTGKCEKLSELTHSLLIAADKYDLVHLKMICAEELYKDLSLENAASILALADMHDVKELKNAVLKFIISEPTEFLKTEGWKSIRSNFELADEVSRAIKSSAVRVETKNSYL